jgi:hypothetical protein
MASIAPEEFGLPFRQSTSVLTMGCIVRHRIRC